MSEYLRKNVWENHVVIAIAIVFLAFILYEIKSVIISVFLAYILAAALSPAVKLLTAQKVSRGLAVVIIYLVFLLILTFILFPLIPFIVSQSILFAENFPFYLNRLTQLLGFGGNLDLLNFVQNEIDTVGKNAFLLTTKVFSGLFNFITTIVVSIYLLMDSIGFKKTNKTLLALDNRLGAWVRGQLTLNLAIGILSWIGLTILGVPHALPLAIMAGFLEMIPLIGPVVSAVPAVIIALTISPTLGLLVIALYIIIQLLENNLLVPKVMQQAVGLNPLAVILGIMIGGQLLGIIGAILAIPIILTIKTVVENRSPS